MKIFSGVKILDLSRVFSGPFATRHFADFGAKVIKIEPPGGEDSRNYPPIVGKWSGYFEILNRNKSAVVIDFKNPRGLNKFYRMCETADVVVENYTPGITKKLKIDYPVIKKINPGIIYASIVGVSGRIQRKYYDVIAQAESGLISLNGREDDAKISTSIVDAFSGMKLAFAVAAALYSRAIRKTGTRITVSMRGSAFDLLEQNLIATSVTDKNPAKVGNHDNAIAPFGIFRTKDGSIAIAIGNDVIWAKFEKALSVYGFKQGRDIYKSNDNRLKNMESLIKDIETVFSVIDSQVLEYTLKESGIPCAEVKTMRDVVDTRENYEEMLLEKVFLKDVGNAVIPAGGIFFDKFKRERFKPAPGLESVK